jgi:dGTPase
MATGFIANMDFSKKITLYRPYDKQTGKDLTAKFSSARLAEQLESDRGRIIQSAAIRRLQQKTQVFPLETNSAVRSRLTHSLEVQQTGRHIVRTIFNKLGDNAADHGLNGLEREIESLVEMSCLMHDIGNPPFGHFGEAAIIDWFKQFLKVHNPFKSTTDHLFAAELKRDIESFEGNAQAFRIIYSLLRLNLTYSQSASILKYTRCGTEPKPAKTSEFGYLKKKVGFYYSEQSFIDDMKDHLEIKSGHRFPLAYLMEAADDISYCLADIEDGVEKGLLSCEVLADLLITTFNKIADKQADDGFLKGKSFAKAIEYALSRSQKEPINKAHEFFVWLRVQLIHPLVEHAADGFIGNIEQVYDGSLNRALLEDNSLFHHVIATFKEVAIKHIFSSKEVETKELQGYRVITQLLEAYEDLLTLNFDDFTDLVEGKRIKSLIANRLFNRLPNKHIRAYTQALESVKSDSNKEMLEFYYRCRLIQDYISGMTDQYAMEEYGNLYP